jgi:uncharacterized protein (TIGR03083 family)
MNHTEYADRVGREITVFADLVRDADMTARVPSCPEWSLGELVAHAGTIHRWMAAMVRDVTDHRYGQADLQLDRPDDPERLPAWLAAGADIAVDALRGVDPDAEMWSWGADKHARFWSRRMVFETGIHRADAELALGLPGAALLGGFEPDLGADGVDEFLDNLPHAAYFSPSVKELTGDGEVLALSAPDAAVEWRVVLGTDGFTWSRAGTDDAVATIAAPAVTLLLVLYRRLPLDAAGVEIAGDRRLAERWREKSAL